MEQEDIKTVPMFFLQKQSAETFRTHSNFFEDGSVTSLNSIYGCHSLFDTTKLLQGPIWYLRPRTIFSVRQQEDVNEGTSKHHYEETGSKHLNSNNKLRKRLGDGKQSGQPLLITLLNKFDECKQ